jgi:hypothetical protein
MSDKVAGIWRCSPSFKLNQKGKYYQGARRFRGNLFWIRMQRRQAIMTIFSFLKLCRGGNPKSSKGIGKIQRHRDPRHFMTGKPFMTRVKYCYRCQELDHLHQSGIVLRDLKPSMLLRQVECLKLLTWDWRDIHTIGLDIAGTLGFIWLRRYLWDERLLSKSDILIWSTTLGTDYVKSGFHEVSGCPKAVQNVLVGSWRQITFDLFHPKRQESNQRLLNADLKRVTYTKVGSAVEYGVVVFQFA